MAGSQSLHRVPYHYYFGKVGSYYMKAEALRWAIFSAGHTLDTVLVNGEAIGARVLPPVLKPIDGRFL
jgi:hypothetical protein